MSWIKEQEVTLGAVSEVESLLWSFTGLEVAGDEAEHRWGLSSLV